MMEKFAEKYIEDNPSKFAHADCAYVLAFSLIMLHTDAHSKSIKPENKMSLEAFIKSNRGINDNQNLPREYLEELYNRVTGEEWTLEEEKGSFENTGAQNQLENLAIILGLFPSGSNRRKFESFIQESSEIVKKTTELIRRKKQARTGGILNTDSKMQQNTYVIASNELIVQVQYLFESVHSTLLTAFTSIIDENLQEGSQSIKDCVELALNGIQVCLQLAAHFEMIDIVDLYVTALARLTCLEFSCEVPIYKEKHIQCISALLNTSISKGNSISQAWELILECISRLNQYQTLIWADSSEVAHQNSSQSKISISYRLSRHSERIPSNERNVTKNNAASVINAIDVSQIELLFMRSVNLSPQTVILFASALCKVSQKELAQTPPRIFSLQKLVEIADHNMNRIRLIWTKIWSVLRGHFVEAASHSDINICLYSIDSLRQLAIKFLEKGEFANYSFQNEFLIPLCEVMRSTESYASVKQFIIDIILNIIQSQGVNLKNGWKSAFTILSVAAELHSDTVASSESLIIHAFDVLELVLKQHFWIAFNYFNELVRCLLTFVLMKTNQNLNLINLSIKSLRSLEAISLLFINIDVIEYTNKYYPDKEPIEIMDIDVAASILSEKQATKRYKYCQSNSPTDEQFDMYKSCITSPRESTNDTDAVTNRYPEKFQSKIPAERYLLLISEKEETPTCLLETKFQQQLSSCWLPIFTSLSQAASNSLISSTISELALVILFRILNIAGSDLLGQDLWQMILRGVLLPLFDDLHLQLNTEIIDMKAHNTSISKAFQSSNYLDAKQPPPPPNWDHWAVHQSWAALNHLVNFASANFDCMQNYLNETINLVTSCIEGQPEFIARLGIKAFKKLLVQIKENCSKDNWSQIVQSICNLNQRTTPLILMNNEIVNKLRANPDSVFEHKSPPDFENFSLDFNQNEIISKCVVQLHLLYLVQDVIQYTSKLYDEDVQKVLDLLWSTFKFARSFNRQVEWRYYLKLIGFMREMRQLPGLLRQEKETLVLLMQICFESFKTSSKFVPFFIECLDHVISELIDTQKLLFSSRNQYIKSEAEREIVGVNAILIENVFLPLASLPDELFIFIFKQGFHKILVKSLLIDSKVSLKPINVQQSVRENLHKVAMSKFKLLISNFSPEDIS